jgi:hemerythrin-like domain-containing protein
MSGTKARAPRTPAPPLPLFESLDRTHRQVLEMLGQLTRLVEQLDATGIDEHARLLATEIYQFFDDTARAHHVAEEELVFPGLLTSDDAELVQHVQRLQQDHGWLEEDWLELGSHVRALGEGQGWYDLDVLRSAIPVFSDLYREHIALEETIVYPASRRRQA